jgi:hypothetical protein
MWRTLDDASSFEAVRPQKVTGLPMRKVRGRENNRLGLRTQQLLGWT